ncbi:hypothetical protein [Luteitalea sp. TBR-22]|uniref:hypothetical protein n=1 Tax=Luteitalea sp. TBR-22 TaxID=2802971 RepID=UPI001EF48BEA|nr:hypothetical protein [Luteitalea sp. TBR-22]
MPLLLVGLVGAVMLLALVLVPVSILQRYRVGTRRRPARAWLASLQVAGFAGSACLVVVGAAAASFWVPGALPATTAAVAGGVLLGVVGAASSRWDCHEGVTHFTPNRWLALLLTLLVVARLGHGVWRAWHAWTMDGTSWWLGTAGVAGSMAAGALLVGYGLGFWAGVRWRIAQRQAGRLRSAC